MIKTKIYLSEFGYKQYLEEIEYVKEKIKKNATIKNESFVNDPGNGWHDNFAFEEASREEDMLISELQTLYNKGKDIEQIKEIDWNPDTIRINSIITIKFTYEDGETELEQFKLTGNWKQDSESSLQEITINSPLGRIIYQKKIGALLEYCVNNTVIRIEILEINS